MTPNLRLKKQRRIEAIFTRPIGILLTTSVFYGAVPKIKASPITDKSENLGWSSFYDQPPILGPSVKFIKAHTGLTIKGLSKSFFYGNVAGGKNMGAACDQELKLSAIYDFGFLNNTLKGLTLNGDIRLREGQNPNGFVGATNLFQPSNIESGKYFRAMRLYFTYTTPRLFGIKEFLTISGGWENPHDTFLQQPLSKLFTNNTLESAKGLSANIPWTTSYAGWGGYMKIKPTHWYYFQTGLYMAIPNAPANHNHGLYFAGHHVPGQPDSLYALVETGFTPSIGPSQLAGKYAFGSYWFGIQNTSWGGTPQQGQYGFYWQADQQLYRVPSDSTVIHEILGTQSTVSTSSPAPLSEKGLYFFSMFTYAPPYNNTLSFYFQSGLVYEGLIPTRDHDKLGIVYGYGSYSDQYANINRSKHLPYATNQSMVEIDYNMALTKWLNFRPFYQLLINPAADNTQKNANVLGFAIFATF